MAMTVGEEKEEFESGDDGFKPLMLLVDLLAAAFGLELLSTIFVDFRMHLASILK